MTTIIGTERPDRLVGTADSDGILGLDGDDGLFGLAGDDKLVGGAGDDHLDGGIGADHLVGGDGMDTASYRHAGAAVTVDLSAGIGLAGEAAGDHYEGVENVVGSVFSDLLVGSDLANRLDGGSAADTLIGGGGNDVLVGGNRNDTLDGGAGRDVLIGGHGTDIMTGGAGADRFLFGIDALHFGDEITDYDRAAGDRMDLSAIDADIAEAGDQAFVFIGTAAFSQRAGELHYIVTGTGAQASGDVDGDGFADFKISLRGVPAVIAEDFVL
ncbi:calcium-binding protein [Inquilinus sp. Marseille-Q2685]|uniref:calcium-binding protein n=1 Tax=Inquilinus sp. Marseille-Q2685 TaxID=2866581 RepID=UPI001CE4080C|nr:calcium-binding protein [Inquilinus sp. Marseille-Q2685]